MQWYFFLEYIPILCDTGDWGKIYQRWTFLIYLNKRILLEGYNVFNIGHVYVDVSMYAKRTKGKTCRSLLIANCIKNMKIEGKT